MYPRHANIVCHCASLKLGSISEIGALWIQIETHEEIQKQNLLYYTVYTAVIPAGDSLRTVTENNRRFFAENLIYFLPGLQRSDEIHRSRQSFF